MHYDDQRQKGQPCRGFDEVVAGVRSERPCQRAVLRVNENESGGVRAKFWQDGFLVGGFQFGLLVPLNAIVPLLVRSPSAGQSTLTIGAEKAATLGQSFTESPMSAGQTTIDARDRL